MEKRDRIFGITTKELVPYLGKVRWLKGDRPAYRHEKYVAKALKSLTIPLDTAIVFTTEKRHPFSMAEIAQGEEEIKGKKQIIYGIFIHEFSVGYLEAIYRQLLAFIPYLEEKDMENVVVAFIQKVLLHELGHSDRYSVSTINQTMSYVEFIEEQLGIDLDMATLEEITDKLYEKRTSGKPIITINNWVKYLNRYLEFRGFEEKLKYFKHTESDDEYFYVPTDEEMRKILSVRWTRPDIDARNRALLHLLFSTGIRINEAVSLNWNDFDLSNPNMPKVTIRCGKGGKKRVVPVHPKVMAMLIEYKDKYRLRTDPNAVFTTPRGRLTQPYARKICKDAGKMAGIPQFHAHAARHWRAISWLKERVDLETIRRLLGHKHLKTTLSLIHI